MFGKKVGNLGSFEKKERKELFSFFFEEKEGSGEGEFHVFPG